MWLRYPVAVVSGYAIFSRLAARLGRDGRKRFNPSTADVESAFEERRSTYSYLSRARPPRGSTGLIFPTVDFAEGCLVALLIGVLFALIGVLVFGRCFCYVARRRSLSRRIYRPRFYIVVFESRRVNIG
jgi:hypothetical protein